MKFSWNWIRELSGTTVNPQQAAEMLTAKSFEVQNMTPTGDDLILDITILPNRPDCLSHIGIARELCVLTNAHFTPPSYEYLISQRPGVPVSVQNNDACLRYSALVVRGITVDSSPAWLKERLERCGLKSINNVVDVVNYVMLELGQPMHAFDRDVVGSIVVRNAQQGETIRALDEAQTHYQLHPSMLVIADESKPLAIAGIKGGAGSGITDRTKGVLLEAASFNPQSIRATSRALGLRTDASLRFSYGVDPNLTPAALVRAGELLAKVAGGTPDKEIIDVYPQRRVAQTIMFDPSYARELLGVSVGDAQIRSILESLGFEVSDVESQKMKVVIPTRRLDVTTSEDLIEEIGRVYGYDAIPSLAPVLPIYDEKSWVKEDAEGVFWDEYGFIRERDAITRLVAGAGYSEVYNYAFLSDELKELLRIEGMSELAQPQSAEYRWLRMSVVPRILINARDNLRFFDEVRLFETGHTFDHVMTSRESTRLGLVLAKRTSRPELAEGFYELKGVVDLLLERIGIADYYYDDASPFQWDAGAVHATASGHQALIRLEDNGHVIGFIGAVSPQVADALKLKGSAAVAELCLRSLIRHAQREREFEPLPKYPSVTRDLSLLVDADTKIDDLLEVIQDADDAGIVRDVDVFDIFVPTGKEKLKEEGDTPSYGKSIAVHVLYRAPDHTLTDREVTLVEDAIKKALQEKLGARIR